MSSVSELTAAPPPPRIARPEVSVVAFETEPAQPVLRRSRDYVELAKPRIALMVLLTVAIGYLLGQRGSWQSATLWQAWLGIGLVAAASSAINQWLECRTDARMRRTMTRPLPAGRLHHVEVLVLGLLAAVIGCAYLAWQVNLLTAELTGLTFLLYTLVYTPLKRWTSLCTAIGAIPGAMPPVLGWTAAGQPLDATAFALFALLFVWQFPHFLAIAWLYRDDYAAAGLKVLPGVRPDRGVVGSLASLYALGLIPVSLLPVALGLATPAYGGVAIVLGASYAFAALNFARSERQETARTLLRVSLVYLPAVLVFLAIDHVRLMRALGS
jgi:protoheme IX farnesyltransferase